MAICLLPTVDFANVGDTFSEDDLNYVVLTDPSGVIPSTVKLAGYSGTPTDISVDTVESGEKSYNVTEVGIYAFRDCTSRINKQRKAGKNILYRRSQRNPNDGNFRLNQSLSIVKIVIWACRRKVGHVEG